MMNGAAQRLSLLLAKYSITPAYKNTPVRKDGGLLC